MWTATNYIIEGRRLRTVGLDGVVACFPQSFHNT